MTRRQIQKVALWVVWSSAALLVIALLTGLLVWAIRNQADDTNHARRQIDALVTEVHDISADAATDRRVATREREALQVKLDASLVAQDAMLRLLRTNGIRVPTRFVTKIERRIVIRHPHHRTRTHHSTHRRRATSSTTRTPTGPGHSGSAPGHRKHHH